MQDSYYQSSVSENQEQYRQVNTPQLVNADDNEVDYSFSRLSVRERRKLFQADEPRIISQYGTLPRGPMSRSVPRYNQSTGSTAPVSAQDVTFRMAPVQRQNWTNQSQTAQRRNSSYDFRPQSIVTSRAVELHSATRPTNLESYAEPMYSPVRQSRPVYRSSPMVIQAGEQPIYPQTAHIIVPCSPTSRISHGMSYTARPSQRERETSPMVREIWPSVQSTTSAQPLRIRVYNSDRPASSPALSQMSTQWSRSPPVYPAYPAHDPRSTFSTSQTYRAVPSPNRAYPQTIATSYTHSSSQHQPAQAYPHLTPVHRRTSSTPQFPQKSITIYPTKRDRQVYQQTNSQRQSQRSDWTLLQPTRLVPTEVSANQARPSLFGPTGRHNQSYQPPPPPPPHQGRVMTLPSRPRPPKVVNRRTPQPDEDAGVTEF